MLEKWHTKSPALFSSPLIVQPGQKEACCIQWGGSGGFGGQRRLNFTELCKLLNLQWPSLGLYQLCSWHSLRGERGEDAAHEGDRIWCMPSLLNLPFPAAFLPCSSPSLPLLLLYLLRQMWQGLRWRRTTTSWRLQSSAQCW